MMVQQFWNRTERGRSTVVLEHLIIQAEVRSSRDHSKDKKYDLLTDKTNLHTQNKKISYMNFFGIFALFGQFL